MVEYKLPRQVEGKELIATLENSARFFDYQVDTKPLSETNPNLATLYWRLLGSGIDENFRYNGLPLKDVEPKIKSVRVYDKQQIPRSKFGAFWCDTEATLWTAEAILDEEGTYEVLPIDMYKKDGLVYTRGARFIHIARAKPLKANNGMVVVKPAVDGLVGKVKELLSR